MPGTWSNTTSHRLPDMPKGPLETGPQEQGNNSPAGGHVIITDKEQRAVRALFTRTVFHKLAGIIRLSLRGRFLTQVQMGDMLLINNWISYTIGFQAGTSNAFGFLYPGAVDSGNEREAESLATVARFGMLFGALLSTVSIWFACRLVLDDPVLIGLFTAYASLYLPKSFADKWLRSRRAFEKLARIEMTGQTISLALSVPLIIYFQLVGLLIALIAGRLTVVLLTPDSWRLTRLPKWPELRRSVVFGFRITVTGISQTFYVTATFQAFAYFNRGDTASLGNLAFAFTLVDLVRSGIEAVASVQGVESRSQISRFHTRNQNKLIDTLNLFATTDLIIASFGIMILMAVFIPALPLAFPKYTGSLAYMPGLFLWTLVHISHRYHNNHVKACGSVVKLCTSLGLATGFIFAGVALLVHYEAPLPLFTLPPLAAALLINLVLSRLSAQSMSFPGNWWRDYLARMAILIINLPLFAAPFIPLWSVALILPLCFLLTCLYSHRVHPRALARFIVLLTFWRKGK